MAEKYTGVMHLQFAVLQRLSVQFSVCASQFAVHGSPSLACPVLSSQFAGSSQFHWRYALAVHSSMMLECIVFLSCFTVRSSWFTVLCHLAEKYTGDTHWRDAFAVRCLSI